MTMKANHFQRDVCRFFCIAAFIREYISIIKFEEYISSFVSSLISISNSNCIIMYTFFYKIVFHGRALQMYL